MNHTTATRRRPKNKAEGALFDFLTNAGFDVSKRGWPDFLCFKDGELAAVVEVKPDANHQPKRDQAAVMRALSRAGIKCFTWNPETGFRQQHP